MTPFIPVIAVAIVGLVAVVLIEIRRANARWPLFGQPRSYERDVQNGRSEIAEGAKHQIHNGGINL